MYRPILRAGLVLFSFVVWANPISAQINWNVTYTDQGTGTGFHDPSLGQARRDSMTMALNYLNTVLDGRGTVNLTFASENNGGAGYIAYCGPQGYLFFNGTFQNGAVYQSARTNTRISSNPDGDGAFNFAYGFNYLGQGGGGYDFVTVAIHEIGHALGFLSMTSSNGQGLSGNPPGSPNIYSGLDRYLQRGNSSSGTPQFNNNIGSSGYGSFTGSASIFTAGNDATSGLFFGGKYTMEVRGGTAAPIFAPGSYAQGSSTHHVNDGSAVMHPSLGAGVVKRFQAYEIAMLMDMGWNVYNWNANTTGSWLAGVNGSTLNVADSNWRTDHGLVFVGSSYYNTFLNPAQAPVLPPYGQVTSNIVLNFAGSGSTGYTSTNDIGTLRLSRLNLNSSSSGTNTITGGTLLFGRNSDGTDSVLVPKIVQSGSGAFTINSTINIASTANGLTVDGTGSGQVTIGGQITGAGRLIKSGGFTLVLSNGSNDYSGGTTITSGILRLGANNVLRDSGAIRLAGGTLSTGASTGFSDIFGAFELTSSSTIALGSGSHSITFGGITGTPAGTLTITGWSGNAGQSGTGGKIIFTGLSGNPNSTYASFLSSTTFQGYGTGAVFLSTGTAGTYELVAAPVPEPATVLGIAAVTLAAGNFLRRRFRRETGVETALPA